jgi:carbon monoxide dehydrogenase subunit G
VSRPITAADTRQIAADVETVFAFLDDPHNHAAVTPGLTDVRDVERLDNGGKRLTYTYRMAGIGVDGEIVQTVHEPDARMYFELRGRLTGTIDLTFEAVDDQTALGYEAVYQLPESLLTTAGAPVLRRFNARQLRTTLDNVAAHVAADDE